MTGVAAAPGARHPVEGRRRRTLMWVLVIFTILMGVKAFYAIVPGMPSEDNDPTTVSNGKDNIVYVVLWLGLYAISGLTMITQIWREGVPFRLIMLMPLALYVIASAMWAENLVGSLVPATMLALDMVVAGALAAIAHPARFMAAMAWINVGLAVVSLILLALIPADVISDAQRPGIIMAGQLFGAYDTKGTLGVQACSSILILLFLDPPGKRLWLRALGLVLLATVVLLANSASAVAAAGVAGAILALTRLLPGLRVIILAPATAIAIVWSLILPFINVAVITEPLGRTADLTGRGTFWPMAPDFIKARPLLGYGYKAFFRNETYSTAWKVWDSELYFFTPEFHNAFLDILIGLGAIGGALYVLVLIGSGTIMLNRTLDRRSGDLMVGLLICFIISSATEYQLLAHNTFATIFLFYCFLVGDRRYEAPTATRRLGMGPRPGDLSPAQAPTPATRSDGARQRGGFLNRNTGRSFLKMPPT